MRRLEIQATERAKDRNAALGLLLDSLGNNILDEFDSILDKSQKDKKEEILRTIDGMKDCSKEISEILDMLLE